MKRPPEALRSSLSKWQESATRPRMEEIVGVVNLSEISRGCFQNCFMGYWIGQPYRRQGFMTEALRLAMDYAFDDLDLHRVEANIIPSNTASIALIKRLGFRLEGLSERYLKINGEWQDHERWALTREEVPANSTRVQG